MDKPMKTVLVTGFEPFGGDAINPSMQTVLELEKQFQDALLSFKDKNSQPGQARLVMAILPVSFDHAARQLSDLLETHKPDVVLCLGYSAKAKTIVIETKAHNLMDARIPDNDGYQPKGLPICEKGSDVLSSRYDGQILADSLKENGIPVCLSDNAGKYVCNCVLYTLLAWLENTGSLARGGFVHLPALVQMRKEGQGMEVSVMAHSVQLLVEAILKSSDLD